MKIQINNTQNIYFSSDFHYHHSGIVKGSSSWDNLDNCRPFETLEEHDKVLIDNINQTVGKNDILFSLGDWSFGNYKNNENITNIKKFREQIKCETIHHILGNHCQEIRKNKGSSRDLFTSISDYLEITVVEHPLEQNEKPLKQEIILSHYSFRTWNKSSHGSWMLYGHSHGNLPDIGGKTMDVGVDTHTEFKPYSYQEIKEIMSKRELKKGEDHH